MKEAALQQAVSSGIGFLHENMAGSDWDCVTNLYRDGILRVLVCPFDLCWKLRESSHLVVIMGTETYDGKERRYIDYPISDLLHMMGKASRQAIDSSGTCVILCCIHRRAKAAHLISSSSVGSI